ncbi:titin-like [Anneissia japonica]|uniref:titin-like n=1 Tax=Anneissia japonica TaxID=1529436 RepID=UPI0014258E1B|nr:titin-like [Anneissia japonica]
MVQVDEEAEDGDTFEMHCKYGPVDTCILDCIWKKFNKDGTSTIITQDSQFEKTTDYKKGNSLLKILKATLSDAGKYQCIVELHGEKQAVANKMLVVNKAPFALEIPDVTTNKGISIVRVYLKFTEVKEDSLKDISDIRWYKGESKETGSLLTHLKKKFSKKRYTAGVDMKNSLAFLTIKVITTKDAGEYSCEVEVKGRKRAYFCSGLLKVEGPLLKSVHERIEAVQGEDVELRWNLLKPLDIAGLLSSTKN